MKKTGILYDNISGNTGDVAIGISLKKILRQLNVEFDELIPGKFNPLDYETIIIGGGYLLRQSPDFFYDKFRVPGNHILTSMGIYGEPKDLDYLKSYRCIAVRSNGDKKKLEYLNEDIHVIPCTTMLLEDIPDLPFTFKKPCIGMHIFPMFSKDEEDKFIHWVSSLPFTIYFVPITHYNKDIQYMRNLKEKIPNSEILPILKSLEVFTIIGKFDYFISCSLHGAIFAYVHNVPFILLNIEDKMQYFMEDRNLEQYLFKNFYEMKYAFEELMKKHPDYIEKISIDKKILKEYVNFLKTVLPVGKCRNLPNDDIVIQSQYQINYLLSDISDLERNISHLKRNISQLERNISLNNRAMQEMNITIQSLNQIIQEKENQITEGLNHINAIEKTIASKDQHLLDISNKVNSLNQEISRISEQYYILNEENNSLKNSISYRLLMKFHMVFIEPLFPQNSKRREIYDLGLKGGRILIKDGWKKFYFDFKNYRQTKRELKKLSENNKKLNLNFQQSELIKNEPDPEKKLSEKLNYFLSDQKRRILFPEHENPIVSIIILTFNNASYTHQCLQSLLEHTDTPYEVLIVDNGSTDTTPLLLKQVDNIIEITHLKNLGFIIGCNEGAKKAKGKYLLFLNNDTVVTKNWLSLLVKTLETYTNCGAVGCKLVWPNGQLQEAWKYCLERWFSIRIWTWR